MEFVSSIISVGYSTVVPFISFSFVVTLLTIVVVVVVDFVVVVVVVVVVKSDQ